MGTAQTLENTSFFEVCSHVPSVPRKNKHVYNINIYICHVSGGGIYALRALEKKSMGTMGTWEQGLKNIVISTVSGVPIFLNDVGTYGNRKGSGNRWTERYIWRNADRHLWPLGIHKSDARYAMMEMNIIHKNIYSDSVRTELLFTRLFCMM